MFRILYSILSRMPEPEGGFVITVVMSLFLLGIPVVLIREDQLKQSAHKAELQAKSLQYSANDVVSRIQYVKDPRTGLCFACYGERGGFSSGSPFAVVPCEEIPASLLTVAQKPPNP